MFEDFKSHKMNQLLSLMLLISVFTSCNDAKPIDTNHQPTDTSNQAIKTRQLVFAGNYATAIYVFEFDTLTGTLNKLTSSTQTINPSYLTIHPNNQWVYVVNETNAGKVSAFSFDASNDTLTFINSVSARGDAPCHISIDNTGKYVMIANYTSGNITILPILPNGSLGEAVDTDQHIGKSIIAGRQDEPHAHMILQANNNFIYNTDLGIDKVLVYKLDTLTGKIENAGVDNNTNKGTGPRHLAFHPNQKWAYVLGELNGTIEVCNLNNQSGALTCFQTISTLPAGINQDAASADIHITPDGKFLYASNRGLNNNIAEYAIDQTTGMLSLIGHQPTGGNTPRNFAIDPSGKFLLVANQNSNNVVTFKIDQNTGQLIKTDITTILPSPVCLKFITVALSK